MTREKLLHLTRMAERTVAAAARSYLHPAGATTITDWLLDMRDAAEAGDRHEVFRLYEAITWKLDLERGWHLEALRGAA